MCSLRRMLAASLATGVLIALSIAGSANAQSVDTSFACTLDGRASTSPNMLVQGGSGSYQFALVPGASQLVFVCTVRAGTQYDIETFSADSYGFYTNTVCGTGFIWPRPGYPSSLVIYPSSITTSAPTGGSTDLRNLWWHGSSSRTNQVDLSYTIQYAAGQGALFFVDSTGEVIGGGAISITPDFDATNPPPPVGCTNHFEMQGSVTGVLNLGLF